MNNEKRFNRWYKKQKGLTGIGFFCNEYGDRFYVWSSEFGFHITGDELDWSFDRVETRWVSRGAFLEAGFMLSPEEQISAIILLNNFRRK